MSNATCPKCGLPLSSPHIYGGVECLNAQLAASEAREAMLREACDLGVKTIAGVIEGLEQCQIGGGAVATLREVEEYIRAALERGANE